MTALTRGGVLMGATAAAVVGTVAAPAVQDDKPLPDEVANAKKRAALIKEINTLVLRMENRIVALQERLAGEARS